jgi:hypothetical protein
MTFSFSAVYLGVFFLITDSTTPGVHDQNLIFNTSWLFSILIGYFQIFFPVELVYSTIRFIG